MILIANLKWLYLIMVNDLTAILKATTVSYRPTKVAVERYYITAHRHHQEVLKEKSHNFIHLLKLSS